VGGNREVRAKFTGNDDAHEGNADWSPFTNEQTADKQTAYNSFCEEFEVTLSALFDTHIIEPTFVDHGDNGKKIMHSTVTAVAHVIYLNQCFDDDKYH